MAKSKEAFTATPSNRWDATHGTYLTGRAHLDGADELAAAMESKWGVDRLRLLVGPDLREKFDRQRYKLAVAREYGALEDIVRESARMCTALSTLNQAATAADKTPQPVNVWEVRLSDGSVAMIVQDDATAKELVAAQGTVRERGEPGRAVSLWTLEEIARLLDHHGDVVKAKLTFPGAVVTATRKSVSDPLADIPHPGDLDDPMPVPLEELA